MLRDGLLALLPAKHQAVLLFAHVPSAEMLPLVDTSSQRVGWPVLITEGAPVLLP